MGRGTEPGPSIYPNCGTTDGYRRHQKHGTTTCAGCRSALAAYMQDYRHGNGINKARLIPDTIIKKHGIQVNA